MQRHRLRAIATVAVIAVAATSCASGADTTSVDEVEVDSGQAAPTSTIVRSRTATDATTTTTAAATGSALGASSDPTAVLTALLGQLAADPALAAQIAELDAIGVANLLGIDLSALQLLGLAPAELASLAEGIGASAPAVQEQLLGGAPDPAVLLGLLAGSLDAESLANGTISTIVQALLAAITGTRIVVSPELTVDLGELLGDIDPETLGPIAADPSNASLLALLTSAWLGSNPLLARQLLANPLLDPALRDLLEQLQELSSSIGDTARAVLLEALYELFPALDPQR